METKFTPGPMELPTKQEFDTMLGIYVSNKMEKIAPILKPTTPEEQAVLSLMFNLQYYRDVLSNILPDSSEAYNYSDEQDI